MTDGRIQLSEEQIARYNEDGFLVVENLLDPELVERAVDRVDHLFAGEFETGVYPDEWHWTPNLGLPNAARQMTGSWKSDLTMASIILSPEMGQISATLRGWSGARFLVDALWLKPYGATETALHQDAMYINYNEPAGEVAVCWIALSDAVPGAGTIEYVRGSHKWQLSKTISEFHAPSKGYHWDMEQAAKQAGVDRPEVVQLNLPAGSCVFHHGKTWHGSGGNYIAGKTRRSLVVVTVPDDATFKSVETYYVPGGYIVGRYKRFGDNLMDESFFPILWTKNGYRTPFLNSYYESAQQNKQVPVAAAI